MAEQERPRRIPGPVWAKLAALAAGSVVLLLVGPRLQGGEGTQPPVALLLPIGLLLITAASTAVYLAVSRDLGFPAMVAWYAVGFHALVILVKFVLGPFGLYEVNQTVDFEAVFGQLSNPAGAIMAAGTVLALYVVVYLIVYRLTTDRPEGRRRWRDKIPRRRRTILLIVGGAILVAATSGAGIVLSMILIASSGLEYMEFVFSSSASALIAIFLAGASVLVGLHFREASAQRRLVADAAGLAGLLWLGLCFIALYHVLWVVYVLVLTSIWPLRTVVPK
ncbi:MAG TPA: hypothetical protein VHJ82_10780 [Actinomycetota bacterium]|nr:hypothetical protein [Actinomycetota bacterium]